MLENRFRSKLEEKEAAELIDQNVSFDFKDFLKKIGPAPSFSEPVGPTPDCLSVDAIWAFHGSSLTPYARTAVEKHVSTCEVCGELLKTYSEAQPSEMPDGLFQRISNRLRSSSAVREKESEGRSFWPRASELGRWLAVPAMAVVLAWVIYPARPYFQRDRQSTQVASLRDSAAMERDITELKDRLAQDEQANDALRGDLRVVTDKLKVTQGQLKMARKEEVAQDEQTSEKLTALDTSVHSELATKAANDDLKNVDTKVVGVRTDLDSTREDLKMARSEIGTLIARNHDEIDQLRRFGERDYIEFIITGKNNPQKVGNVTLELVGVNPKKNQFSVAVTADDKRVEKKDRALNEPIVFYLSGTKIPEELVVNRVGDNSVSGYVSIPKASNP